MQAVQVHKRKFGVQESEVRKKESYESNAVSSHFFYISFIVFQYLAFFVRVCLSFLYLIHCYIRDTMLYHALFS